MDNYRILLVGCSGSGKSTLARELAEKLDLPLLHLDRIWHTTDYSDSAQKSFAQTQIDFVNAHKGFIIDGNYSGTMAVRVPTANLIIWLQVPRFVSMYRVITRSLKNWMGIKKRPDMPAEFKEKFDREYWEFLKFVWNFKKNSMPRITAGLEHKADGCEVMVVKNKKDLDVLLKQLLGD